MARVYGRRGPGKPVRFFLYYMACCLVLIVIGASLYGLLRWRLAGDYRYAARYFQVRNDILGDRNPIEQKDDVLKRLRRDYEGRYVGQRHRLVFIGTSQTWGSGASKNGLDWVSLVQRKLDEGLQVQAVRMHQHRYFRGRSPRIVRFVRKRMDRLRTSDKPSSISVTTIRITPCSKRR